MKVALVHDYLREYGEAERVLQVLHQMYPDAPIYTAFVDYKRLGDAIAAFANWDIRPAPSQQLPGITRHYQTFRAILPYIWESLDLSAYDLVLSSSGYYLSQSVLTRSQTLHISYCHTPPRDLWEAPPSERESRTSANLSVHRWYQHWAKTRLRQYDFYAAQQVDRFVTSAEIVARRIRKFYRRTVEVIPPPVTIKGKGEAGDQYYLYVGPLTQDGEAELAIAACIRLDRPLCLVGTGTDADRLQRYASSHIRFLGHVPDDAMSEVYAHAKALLFPSQDADFGFVPVEAMGYGIPVIASALSGIREIILNYRTGLLFDEPTVDCLCRAIAQFEGLRFSSQACIERAREFAKPVFIAKLEWFIAQAIDEHNSHPQAQE